MSSHSGAYITGITNKYKKATVNVIKVDHYSNDKKAHGDASLDGAEFQLYADAACTNKATVYNENGIAKTAGIYTTKNAELMTDYLRSGCTDYSTERLSSVKGSAADHRGRIRKDGRIYFQTYNQRNPRNPRFGKSGGTEICFRGTDRDVGLRDKHHISGLFDTKRQL